MAMFDPQGPSFYELAVQALSSTQRGYDLLAPKFDHTPFRTPDEVVAETLRVVLSDDAQGECAVGSALDVCCGTGAAMLQLKPLCNDRLVGIDFSPGMLQVAETLLTDVDGRCDVDLVQGDVLDMEFDAEFDLACCFGALGHIVPKDQDRFVQRIHKALRPGGRFVFVTSANPSIYSPAYWVARGFNVAMHVRNLLIRPPFIMFYLQFTLAQSIALLERNSFTVDVLEGDFARPFNVLKIISATRD